MIVREVIEKLTKEDWDAAAFVGYSLCQIQ